MIILPDAEDHTIECLFFWTKYRNVTDGRTDRIGPAIQRSALRAIRTHCNTRNSPGDEIANVNFLYGDFVHALQNTIDWCINSATDRRGYVLERRFAKFSEITQCNGHYAVQGHSRSPVLVPIESSYTTSY